MAFEALQEKAGPLPVWVWGTLGAVGIGGFLLLTRAAGSQDQTRGTLQGQPITPIGTGNTADPTGNLAAINGMLTELMGRVNGTGQQSSGGGITSTGLQSGIDLRAYTEQAHAENVASIDQITQLLKAKHADINSGAGFNDYLTWRNVFHNTVLKQQQDIQAKVAAATPNLSASDAAYLQLVSQQEQTRLWQQFSDFDVSWQRSQGVAI